MQPETQTNAPSTPTVPAPRAAEDGRPPEDLINSAASAQGYQSPHRPARGHGYEQRGLAYLPVSRLFEGRFGRMFRLPPFIPSEARIAEIAATMAEGPTGGDPTFDNPDIPSGYTYFGQFVDHDLTFDPVSSLTRQNDPDALTDFRSPRFDLDCVYGRGPVDDPYLYDKSPGNDDKLLLGEHDDEQDLPRNSQSTALIGDPRNDENTFVSQLQLTMLKFHNAVVDLVRGDPRMQQGSETVFEAAQRIVRWHYQWVVVHDFLRRTVGDAMLGSVLDESGPMPRVTTRHYEVRSSKPYMPVEFSVAAYRFGHSQVRGRYKLNTLVGPLATFLPNPTDDPDVRLKQFGGFRILPRFWTIEWRRFFELDEGADLQHTRKIDTHLSNPLTDLPPEIAGMPNSLIVRNLTRGARMSLPSGQNVAAAMGETRLTDGELGLPGGGPAPLWYYILREAEVRENGLRLGAVGGRIVAEVLLGLLAKDPSSYLRHDPTWRPFLPATTAGEFTMPDLIRVSGHGLVDITPPGPIPPAPPPAG
jgi:hypothetical protein